MNTLRDELVKRLQTERRRLESNLAALDPESLEQPGVVRQWSVKDVLAHLAEWEAMGLEWVAASRRGQSPPCPAPGFTWRQVDGPGGLNDVIFRRFHECSVDEVMSRFRDVHQQFEAMVATLSQQELTDPTHFPWTEGAPFSRWVNGFAAHDLWAKKKICASFLRK